MAAGIVPLLSLAACSHVFYAPTVPNAPLLREPGEIRTSGHIGGSSEIDWMGEGTVAVALRRHLGVYGAAVLAGGSETSLSDRVNSGFGGAADIGFGYYRHSALGLGIEGIGGLQIGRGRNTSEGAWRVTYSFLKPYAQLNAGYRGRLVEAVVAQRIGRLAYVGIAENTVVRTFPRPDSGAALTAVRPVVVYEPSMSVRVGREPFKVGFDIGWTHPTSATTLRYDDVSIAFGFYYTARTR